MGYVNRKKSYINNTYTMVRVILDNGFITVLIQHFKVIII